MHSSELQIHLNILPKILGFTCSQKLSSLKNKKKNSNIKSISPSRDNIKHSGEKFSPKQQAYS